MPAFLGLSENRLQNEFSRIPVCVFSVSVMQPMARETPSPGVAFRKFAEENSRKTLSFEIETKEQLEFVLN